MTFLILKCFCKNCDFDFLTIVKGEKDDGRWTDGWVACPNCEELLVPDKIREEVGSIDWNQFKNMWSNYSG